MFRTIMVPVDLAHPERLDRAISIAATMAEVMGAQIHLVGVTMSAPSKVAHTPEEFDAKLEEYAAHQGRIRNVEMAAHTVITNDAAVDLDKRLIETADQIGADLVVMATHVPGLAEYVFASHGGYLAAHAKQSVLLVR
ncbi:universal stress protein [Rhodobacteraceae bacterium NNCM2]|nr:universal stress protein [Coraliihabitans acroporae]